MICQGLKRMKWRERLSSRLFKVPYAHITFTLPHQLNSLIRRYPAEFYNILFRASWKTIYSLAKDEDNVGAIPGMIAVLHTWGSDLKTHIHVHTLVTFGGLNNNEWAWPKRKHKIAPFRKLSSQFRTQFLELLKRNIQKGKIELDEKDQGILQQLRKIRWVVNHQRPTANTETVEEYLSRYICRSAITANRVEYDAQLSKVAIKFKDYRQQKAGQPAPYAYKYLHPLDAIHEILKHKLPPYFQRCRYYGLHATATQAKVAQHIPAYLKRNGDTIKLLFSLLKAKLGMAEINQHVCSNCNYTELLQQVVSADSLWPYLNIPNYRNNKSPPFPKSQNK